MAHNMTDEELAKKVGDAAERIKKQVAETIVGQEAVIEEILISLFVEGHSLIVGVPGLAKTLLVSTLAQSLALKFNRVQFTPDLMPSDITGTDVIQEDKATRERMFKFLSGPIFANVILADEINRTPPKTQAALLQAMQERKVTVGGQTYDLPRPFFVLATQNPIEQEGTYPLPEAQLDRFLLQINISYPNEEEERAIVRKTTSAFTPVLKPVLHAEEIQEIQSLVRRVPVADSVVNFAVRLARSTRPAEPGIPEAIKKWVTWGAGPRASQALILGAKARALLRGYTTPSVDDVRFLAYPVFRHRLILTFHADAERITSDQVIADLLRNVND